MTQEKVILENQFIRSLKQKFGNNIVQELNYKCNSTHARNICGGVARKSKSYGLATSSLLVGLGMPKDNNAFARFNETGKIEIFARGDDLLAPDIIHSTFDYYLDDSYTEHEKALKSILNYARLELGSINAVVDNIALGDIHNQPIIHVAVPVLSNEKKLRAHKVLAAIAYYHGYRIEESLSGSQMRQAETIFGVDEVGLRARIRQDPRNVLKAIQEVL
jgi:hypothetical protein